VLRTSGAKRVLREGQAQSPDDAIIHKCTEKVLPHKLTR
jgi:hypothetical protein